MSKFTALVAGAQGLVGRYFLQHLDANPDWDVIGTSRRKALVPSRARLIEVDLLDRADCARKLIDLDAVTHIFFTAITLHSDDVEKTRLNVALLVNLLETVLPRTPKLRHIQLMQGTNWYGNHLGPYKTPSKETDPRLQSSIFYYPQQDFLIELQKGKPWTWSALRPQGVYGFAVGNPMNHLNALALYGSISKELGLPLRFPGKPGAFTGVYQWTDAAHLAKAMEWAATTPACAGQALNISNGDVDRWCNLWPKLARFFGTDAGPVQTVKLTEAMADKEVLWASMVEKHGLQRYRLADLVSWAFADGIYSQDYDHLFSMTKARNAGWHHVIDTEDMLLRQLGQLRRDRIIP